MSDEAAPVIEETNEDDEGCDDDVATLALKSETAQFVESEAVRETVGRLAGPVWDEAFFGAQWDWLVITIAKYQEMPTLLNPYLEPILGPVFERLVVTMTGFGLMGSGSGAHGAAEGKGKEQPEIKVRVVAILDMRACGYLMYPYFCRMIADRSQECGDGAVPCAM